MTSSNGQLTLSESGTAQCVSACDQYLMDLARLKTTGQSMVRVESFGTLPSGQALGKKFFDLATGGNQSFEQVIQQHIDVIQRLRDVFVQAGAGYRATEDDNTALLNNSIK